MAFINEEARTSDTRSVPPPRAPHEQVLAATAPLARLSLPGTARVTSGGRWPLLVLLPLWLTPLLWAWSPGACLQGAAWTLSGSRCGLGREVCHLSYSPTGLCPLKGHEDLTSD